MRSAGAPTWEPPRLVRYACPGLRCDVVPYTFYRHAPAGYLLDVVHVPMDSYAPLSGKAFAQKVVPMLADRAAEVVVLGGSAFSMANTYDQLRAELAEVSAEVGSPVVTNLLAVVEEMRRDGVGSVVVCHRLAGVEDDVLTRFLGSAGIECRQVVSAPTSLASNMASGLVAGARTAAELVDRAAALASADAVLLLGGSWLVDAAVAAAQRADVTLYNNVLAIPKMVRRGIKEVASW